MNTTVAYSGGILREYGRILRARWRWIVWGVLLALLAPTVVLILWPPLYRSEAAVFVRTPGDVSRVRDGGDSYAQARAGTYAALASSKSLSDRVIANLGLDLEPETLAGRITAQNRRGTALIDIAVRAPSAAEAQRTGTVLLSEYAATVRALESVPGSLVPRAELVVVDSPQPASRVVAWGAPIPLVLLGAALLGAFLGAAGAVIRSILASSRDQSAGDDTNPTSVAAEVTTGSEDTEAIAADVVTAPKHAVPESEQGTGVHRLSKTSTAEVIDRLRSEYEDVVVAGAPVLMTAAGSPMAEYADEVLLVASIGKTRRRELSRAAAMLRAAGAPLTGTVLVSKDDSG